MQFYLFNCRPLKLAPSARTDKMGGLAIYTAFHPDYCVCCDIVIFTEYASDGVNCIPQCTMLEETPTQLDPDIDHDMLQMFDMLIEDNEFSEANLPDSIANDILDSAMPLEASMVTH
jgi:hypothetical protein